MNSESLVKVTNNTLLKLDETINYNSDMYKRIMFIYSSALKEFETKVQVIQDEYKLFHKSNLIDHVKTRVKLNESIITKMKKKNINLSYGEMIEKINDIAGMRIICPMRNDIGIIRERLLNICFPELEKIFKSNRIYDDTALNFIKEFPHVEIVKEKQICKIYII